MKWYGDVKITHSQDGGQITFSGGQPDMDDGIGTAAYLSIFTERGWWGDESIGSDLYKLSREPLSNRIRLEVIEACKKALAWMKEVGLADSVAVDAAIPAAGQLVISITTTRKDNPTRSEYRYQLNWTAMQEAR